MKSRARPLLAAAMALAAIVLTHRAVIAQNLTANSGLGFGRIVASGAAGNVTVSPLGGRTSSGGVVLSNGFGASAASFTVSGQPNTGYSIMLPSSCTLSGGGSSMTADSFKSNPVNGQNVDVGPGGTASFTVGATLHVGANQRSAAYSGTYAVTIAYD